MRGLSILNLINMLDGGAPLLVERAITYLNRYSKIDQASDKVCSVTDQPIRRAYEKSGCIKTI